MTSRLQPAAHRPTATSTTSAPVVFGYLLTALCALLVAWYLQPNILGDDAAITFRYADRLRAGHGMTYNDHEHVLGASNPLYVIVLFLLTYTGMDAEATARVIALVLFPAVALLAVYCTTVLAASRIAGFAAGTLLVFDDFFRYQALSGMESILAVFLGLLAVAAILKGKDVAAGVLVGLAVWNKLDAGMLALAIAAAWLLVKRQIPVRIALTAVAVVLPWGLIALWYYGSPIPHSFVTKAHGIERFNHEWILTFLLSHFGGGILVAATAVLGFFTAWTERARLGVLTLFGWFVLHASAFSAMDLGDYYPWYLTALVPPIIILACVSFGRVLQSPMRLAYRGALGFAAAMLLFPFGQASVRQTYRDLAEGNPIKSWEAFDADRRLAGLFLSKYSAADEIVSSGFGWVALEANRAFNDETGLNSQQMLAPDAYRVYPGFPWTSESRPPLTPDGFIPLAVFNLASDLFPGYTWFTVFGRPDSQIALTGPRHLQYRLFELPPPAPTSAEAGLNNIRISGPDLFAHPPSGATFSVNNAHQPVRVVFTPSFARDVPEARTDGVTFEVSSDGTPLYRRHILTSDAVGPTMLDVSDAENRDQLTVSFVTSPGPRNDPDYDWALWRGVKIIVGDATLDIEDLRNQKLVEAWSRHNPARSRDATPIDFGAEFFPEERGADGSAWRWMSEQGALKVRNTSQDMVLTLHGRTLTGVTRQPIITLELNGERLDQFAGVPGSIERTYLVPAAKLGPTGWSTVRITSSETFVPNEINPQSADRRRLGFAIHRATWTLR